MRKEAGHFVGGKYELLRPLGRGSMGEVWVANHRALGQQVAVKLLSRGVSEPEACEATTSATARFRFEARVAAQLSLKTRHIVRVTDYGEEDGCAYLVMELLDGRTLESKLLVRGRVPPAEVATLVSQIGRALEVAHGEGVVHRDLKPANVFLTSDEDGWLLVKLLDFGIARTTHTHRAAPSFATADGLVFGTPGYMSPEQARGARADARCDLWSLATVAYEALTGELPVSGSTTSELLENVHAGHIVPIQQRDPELGGGLAAFFERAFARRIEDRYPSAAAMASAFERAVGSQREALAPTVAASTPPQRGQTLRIESMWAPPPKTQPVPAAARSSSARSTLLPLSLVALFACAGAAETVWRSASLSSPALAASQAEGSAGRTAAQGTGTLAALHEPGATLEPPALAPVPPLEPPALPEPSATPATATATPEPAAGAAAAPAHGSARARKNPSAPGASPAAARPASAPADKSAVL